MEQYTVCSMHCAERDTNKIPDITKGKKCQQENREKNERSKASVINIKLPPSRQMRINCTKKNVQHGLKYTRTSIDISSIYMLSIVSKRIFFMC